MSRLATGSFMSLPAPVMGVDWTVPASRVEYPYTPYSLDWIANGYEVKHRELHLSMANTTGFYHLASYEAANTIIACIPSGGSAGVYSYNVSTKAATVISAVAYVFGGHTNYQGRVYLAKTNGPASWDGTTYTAVAFSGASGGTNLPGCCIYRDRYVQVQAQSLFFASIAGATSGALSTFNLASYYSSGEFVACAPITITDSNNLSDYLVCVSMSGDVLAFTGDFPGSANWQLVVKTKVPVSTYPGDISTVSLVPYAGDAFLQVKSPASLISMKTLIQKGKIEAEASSPLAKVSNFIKSRGIYGQIRSAFVFPLRNAILVNCYLYGASDYLQFGFTPTAQNNDWLYVDMASGAISPFSYPEFYGSVTGDPYSNKSVSHSDGYVYSLQSKSGVITMWKLFGDSSNETLQSTHAFLQFPYSDLGSPEAMKGLSMAQCSMERVGGYVGVNLAINYDNDSDITQTFESDYTGSQINLISRRIALPIAGGGNRISVAITNFLRWGLGCRDISIQFEPGGPY